jgi:hypothetical protein
MRQDTRQWHQLLKIGSARAGSTSIEPGEPLDTVLPLDTGPIEARLWMAIGARDLWERSGFQPAAQPAAAPSPAAPPERLRSCPVRAEALLALLLRGAHPAGLLSEWLQLLGRHGARLPARFLPNLLDAAVRQPRLRPWVRPVLGERGQWLARRQPAWGRAQSQADSPGRALAWDTGSIDQRVAVLCDWRADDPAGARQALSDAWRVEPPEQRAALLPALAVGLSGDDEDFLEAALDDRRKEVRAPAQRLLAGLPGSRLSQRMLARLLPLMQVERRLLRAPRLQLSLPVECDAAMRRDGIGADPWPGLGEKAGWVVDMLSAVDPRVWLDRFGDASTGARTPRALLALAEDSEFAAVLVRGWALASVRHATHDAASWLLELGQWWTGASPALRNAIPDSLFDALGMALRHDEHGGLSALVDGFPTAWHLDPQLVRLLQRLADQGAGSWPAPLSGRVLRRIEAALPALPALPQPWAFRQLLSSLSLALDPAIAAAVGADWHDKGSDSGIDSQWRDAFDTFSSTVRLRHEMILSFQEPA